MWLRKLSGRGCRATRSRGHRTALIKPCISSTVPVKRRSPGRSLSEDAGFFEQGSWNMAVGRTVVALRCPDLHRTRSFCCSPGHRSARLPLRLQVGQHRCRRQPVRLPVRRRHRSGRKRLRRRQRTTASRSSPRPAPTSPSGAALAAATASSTPRGHRHRPCRKRLRSRWRQQSHPEVHADRHLHLQWGTSGSGDGQFSNPLGVTTDPAGNVYVADAGNDRIQKFTSAGTFLTKWGTDGSGDGQFDNPSASRPTRPATSTSPTPTTTASRSSPRPAPSSPNGAPPAAATVS